MGLVGLICPLLSAGCVAATPQAGVSPDADLAALRQVRVLLRADTGGAKIAVEGPYRILDAAGRVLYERTAALPASPVSGDFSGLGKVYLAELPLPSGSRLAPRQDGTIEVDSRRYRGSLVLLSRGRSVYIVNVLDVEDYIKGVLAGEMPARFHLEAYKAQAVAARTYVLYQKFVFGRNRDYDVVATQASQMYIGLAGETPKALEAVTQTYGRVLTWTSPAGEKLFCPYYHSTCGGITASIGEMLPIRPIPPLAGGVRTDACSHSKYYRWEPVTLSRQYVTQRLRARYALFRSLGPIVRIEPIQVSPEGRLVWLRLIDEKGRRVRMRAAQFRLAVGSTKMRSTWCRIVNTPDGFALEDGRGFGHGVGMCQYGADGLARAGWSWRQILAHYYPGSHITKAY